MNNFFYKYKYYFLIILLIYSFFNILMLIIFYNNNDQYPIYYIFGWVTFSIFLFLISFFFFFLFYYNYKPKYNSYREFFNFSTLIHFLCFGLFFFGLAIYILYSKYIFIYKEVLYYPWYPTPDISFQLFTVSLIVIYTSIFTFIINFMIDYYHLHQAYYDQRWFQFHINKYYIKNYLRAKKELHYHKFFILKFWMYYAPLGVILWFFKDFF